MIIMSEILNKRFDTPEECLVAEQQYKEKIAAEEAEKAQNIEAIKVLMLAATDAVHAADDAIDKAADALFAHFEKFGDGKINFECPEEKKILMDRTLSMVARKCDMKELKQHRRIQREE